MQESKNVFFVSDSLGDTIACMPYLEKYYNENNVNVISVSDNYLELFKNSYKNINLIGRDKTINYDVTLDYDFKKPIQRGYSEQLGYKEYEYLRPKLEFTPKERPIKNKYVTIGIHSTAQLKYWNSPLGEKVQPFSHNWNELCGLIRKAGYTPVVVEKNETWGVPPNRNGMPQKAVKKFGQSFEDSLNYIYHSEFYIGLSSGFAWVAHALGKKVAMIANFTEDWNEFDLNCDDYIRITNKNVCHGCWHKYEFDKSNWYWCPIHKGTGRQFECHTSITPEFVFNEIKKWM